MESSDLDPFREPRERMVQEQIAARGIHDEAVLAAMRMVPRHLFVPAGEQHLAYADNALPIGFEQTISQPFTVAFMVEALRLKPTDRVLEIGGGSGYAAAVLSRVAAEFFCIERIPQLAERAQRRIDELGYENITLRCGDGTLGWQEQAPFEAIVVAAGGQSVPAAYWDQLAEGGRLVIPIDKPGSRGQEMMRYIRRGTAFDQENLGRFAFVPLIGS